MSATFPVCCFTLECSADNAAAPHPNAQCVWTPLLSIRRLWFLRLCQLNTSCGSNIWKRHAAVAESCLPPRRLMGGVRRCQPLQRRNGGRSLREVNQCKSSELGDESLLMAFSSTALLTFQLSLLPPSLDWRCVFAGPQPKLRHSKTQLTATLGRTDSPPTPLLLPYQRSCRGRPLRSQRCTWTRRCKRMCQLCFRTQSRRRSCGFARHIHQCLQRNTDKHNERLKQFDTRHAGGPRARSACSRTRPSIMTPGPGAAFHRCSRWRCASRSAPEGHTCAANITQGGFCL